MAAEGFDLRLAAPFVAVAEELHFGRAAERLGIRQPALSQQLARLERQLGVPLIGRGGGAVTLTPAGARFLVEVREMLAAIRRAEAALRRGGGGELRLYNGTVTSRTVGDLVASFVAEHPDIVVNTTDGAPSAVPRAVLAGTVDGGFALPEDVSDGLRYLPLARTPLGVATAADHPITTRTPPTWADLEGEPVFVAPPGLADGWNLLVRTTLRRMQVRVREVDTPQFPQVTYLQHHVATGVALLLSPYWMFDPLPPGVAWTALDPPQRFELGMIWDDRTAGEVLRRFVAWAQARSPVDATDACEE